MIRPACDCGRDGGAAESFMVFIEPIALEPLASGLSYVEYCQAILQQVAAHLSLPASVVCDQPPAYMELRNDG